MEEIEIWRAANQLIKQYSEEASITAAQRADKALAIGDMFNFNLWTRIAMAVQELERQKPGSGETVN